MAVLDQTHSLSSQVSARENICHCWSCARGFSLLTVKGKSSIYNFYSSSLVYQNTANSTAEMHLSPVRTSFCKAEEGLPRGYFFRKGYVLISFRYSRIPGANCQHTIWRTNSGLADNVITISNMILWLVLIISVHTLCLISQTLMVFLGGPEAIVCLISYCCDSISQSLYSEYH